jgi:hypothetical protein
LVYRAGVRRPLELVWLGPMVRQVEDSVGTVIARAPGRDQRRGRDEFPGYRVIEALPSGGSGARLWLAEPVRAKHERNPEIAREKRALPERVVIKSFALDHGTELPQLLRENRSLEAARRMGHVIEHGSDGQRFYYVMPYVPGEDLRTRTLVLHERADRSGLDVAEARIALGYLRDLLDDLERFHAAGLWHKDVKPENILVDHGRARLVDLGLVTPLASAMTLTTHGTEYFRDPELVREALRGAKVHEVDGVRFDLYGAGAVLYSLFESSFPAHGVLSRFTKRCPDAVAWIVRRAMADMHHRYRSAREMRADVDAVLAAADPYAVKPAALPSWRGEASEATVAAAEFVPGPALPGASGLAEAATSAASFAASRVLDARAEALASGVPGPRVSDAAPGRKRAGRGWILAAAMVFLVLVGLFFAASPTRVSSSVSEYSTVTRAGEGAGQPYRLRSTLTPKGGRVVVASFFGTGATPSLDGGPLLVVDLRGGRAREEAESFLAQLAAEGIELHGLAGAPQDKELAKLQADVRAEYLEHVQNPSRITGFRSLLLRRSAKGLDGFLCLRAARAGGDERIEVFAALREGVTPLPELLEYLPARPATQGR